MIVATKESCWRHSIASSKHVFIDSSTQIIMRRLGVQPFVVGCAMASMSSSSPHRDSSTLYLSWSRFKSMQQSVLIIQWIMFGFCAQNKISQQFVGKMAGTHSLRPLPHMELFLGTRGWSEVYFVAYGTSLREKGYCEKCVMKLCIVCECHGFRTNV